MTAKFEIGSVYTGKVTGLQAYGAFVALDEETQGLVHISEVTHGFRKRHQRAPLAIGDEVQVKVLSVDEEKLAKSAFLSVLHRKHLNEKKSKPKDKRLHKSKIEAAPPKDSIT